MARPTRGAPNRPLYAVRLEALRQLLGMDQKTFAERIGLEPETYRRYERGETQPNVQTWAKIRETTGFTLDFLIAGKEPMVSGDTNSDRATIQKIA